MIVPSVKSSKSSGDAPQKMRRVSRAPLSHDVDLGGGTGWLVL